MRISYYDNGLVGMGKHPHFAKVGLVWYRREIKIATDFCRRGDTPSGAAEASVIFHQEIS